MSDEVTTPETSRSGLRYWSPLIATCLAMFIVVVDSTMMNVAIPAIVEDLQTSLGAVQAVIAIYSLVMAMLVLTGGRMGAIFGVKRMFIAGVLIYGVGTLTAAVSQGIGTLALGWAFIEGVGAALITPLAFTLIIANYSGVDRAKAFGVLAGVQASGAAIGPILGGVLTTYASWRWGFALEAIIAAIIFLFVPTILEMRSAEEGTTVDWVGSGLSIVAMGSLVLGFLLGAQYGWFGAIRPFFIGDIQFNPVGLSPVPFLLGIGIIFFVLFIHWQKRREAHGQTPLISMKVLTNSSLIAGVSTFFVRGIFTAGFIFVIPVFLQAVVGFDAFQSGLALFPFSVGTFLFALISSSWASRIAPKYLIQTGTVIMLVGVVLLIYSININLTIAEMIIPMSVFGIGMGLLLAHLTNLTLSVVSRKYTPEASGLNNALGYLGMSIGTALAGSLMIAFFLGGITDDFLATQGLDVTRDERTQIIVKLEDGMGAIQTSEGQAAFDQLPDDVQQNLTELIDINAIEAMQWTLTILAFFVIVTLLVGSFLPKRAPSPEELEAEDEAEPLPASA